MFAGPNGSGKSTLKSKLVPELRGVYLNPDEIEATIKQTGRLCIADYGVRATTEEILSFFLTARLLIEHGLQSTALRLAFDGKNLLFSGIEVNSYWASATADFLQQKLVQAKASFTLETVMSHPSKIAVLTGAQTAGYRTYLYFIATDDPEINISRVQNRVNLGGHPVPEHKIRKRYHRSLGLLPAAVRATNRAYIFDNSGAPGTDTWLAEITDSKVLDLKVNPVPAWFKKALLDPLGIK
ncbi:MAG: zeta toxin family protein [Verrucomicrobia bacterium]|nr:zeta toxin family protein [Verrucomicrobiota bacterium]